MSKFTDAQLYALPHGSALLVEFRLPTSRGDEGVKEEIRRIATFQNLCGWVAMASTGNTIIGSVEGPAKSVADFQTWLIYGGKERSDKRCVEFLREDCHPEPRCRRSRRPRFYVLQ